MGIERMWSGRVMNVEFEVIARIEAVRSEAE
jgi:hypothetical protein